MPFKRFTSLSVLMPFLLPPYIAAMGWILLADPHSGMLNVFLSLFHSGQVLNIYSYPGLIWTLGSYQVPFAFLAISATLSSIDFTLIEQSEISGASALRTIRTIVIPLLLPTLISTLLLVFAYILNLFTVYLFLGVPARINTLPVIVFLDVFEFFPPQYGEAVVSSVILLVFTVIAIYVYYKLTAQSKRFVTISGKGLRTGVIKLGGSVRYALLAVSLIFILVSMVLPLVVVALASLVPVWTGAITKVSLSNYLTLFSENAFDTALANTVVLSVASALALGVVGFGVTYMIFRTHLSGRRPTDFITTLPIVVPGFVFGFGEFLAWVVHIPLGITGTLAIMWLALISRNLPYASRNMSNAVLQIDPELEEAAAVSGSSPLTIIRKINWPLMRRNILYTVFLIFTLVVRDLGSILFVYTSNTTVVPVLILYSFYNGRWPEASSIAIILVILAVVGVVLMNKYSGQESRS